MKYDYDVIIMGAGSGGLTAYITLSLAGKKVLLVERDRMGGECTNTGCIPSKSLIHLAREFAEAKEAAGDTNRLKKHQEDAFDQVRTKVKEIRDEEEADVLEKKYKNKVIKGEASFADAHTVVVKGKDREKRYTAKYIIISTGSSPRTVPIEGLPAEKLLTNENLFDLKEAPQKLLVLGAGPIGCEMSQALNHLGTEITIVTNTEFILPREETEIAQAATEEFEARGINVIPNSTIKKVEGRQAIVEQVMGAKKKTHKVEFDYLLMGVGRIPNIQNLNLAAAGIEFTDRQIVVDKHYRTSAKNVFAIGDVSSRAKFTHTAEDQGRHVMKYIMLPFCSAEHKKPIPRVTYLDQEVGSVGITYEDAVKKYGKDKVVKISVPYGETDRAKTDEATKGSAVVVAKKLTGRILGACLMGRNAGELISVFTLCMQYNLSLYKLNKMIVPYPILGQLYKKLSDQYIGYTLKNLKKDLKMMLKEQGPRIFALIFWGTLMYLFYDYKADNDLSWEQMFVLLADYLRGNPWLYIIAYTVRPLILFPATLLTALSGYLFGFWFGALYTIMGENFSANLAYFLGRFVGKDLIPEEGEGLLSSWKRELAANSFVTVLILRTIYLPFDLVNYGCGVLNVKWAQYALATFIGILPALFAVVSVGTTIENIESFKLSAIKLNPESIALSVILFVISFVVAYFVKRHAKVQMERGMVATNPESGK